MTEAPWSGTMLMVRGSDTVIEECSGVESAGLAITPTSRFQAGSLSKLVLAVIIVQLADQGVVSLDEPVGRWIPEAPRGWQGATLHQLLTHTAGLGHWADVPGLDLGSPPSIEGLQAMITSAHAVAEPGKSYSYSGLGYLVAAQVAAAVTDHAYADLVHQLVVDRVGMTRTTSGQYPVGQLGVALGHHDGQPLGIAPVFTELPGTGDLWTTATDMIKFAQALRGDLLSAEGRRLFTAEAVPIPDQRADGTGVIKTAAGYGRTIGSVLGHPAYLSTGDNPGYQSLLAWFPESDTDLVILSNDDGQGIGWPVHAAIAQLGAPS